MKLRHPECGHHDHRGRKQDPVFNVVGQLQSPTVQADGRFSLVDASLALAVLIGLALNAVLGWWWADGVLD